jgi:hypothetical protein
MLQHKDQILQLEGLMEDKLQKLRSERDLARTELAQTEQELTEREQVAFNTTTLKINKVRQALNFYAAQAYEAVGQTFTNERRRLKEIESLLDSADADYEELRTCMKQLQIERGLLHEIAAETERLSHILSQLAKTLQVKGPSAKEPIVKCQSLNPSKPKTLSKLHSLPLTRNPLNVELRSRLQFTSRLAKGRLFSEDLRTGQVFTLESELIETGARLASLDNGVFMLTGGLKQSQCTARINVCSGTLQLLACMQTGRYSHTAVTVKAGVMVMGGYSRGALRSVEIWENGIWQTLNSMLFPRFEHSAVLHTEQVYVIGGRFNSQELLDSLEVWDGCVWNLLSVKLPLKAALIGLLPLNSDELMLVGGKGFDNKTFTHTWVFAVAQGHFTEGPSLKFSDEFWYEGVSGSERVTLEGTKGTHSLRLCTGEFEFCSAKMPL